MRSILVLLGATIGFGTAAGLGGCSKSVPKTVTITVSKFTYPKMSVPAGGKVILDTTDDEGHTITADDGSFSSPQSGPHHPVTFAAPTKKGSYLVHCNVHSSMHGTFTVT